MRHLLRRVLFYLVALWASATMNFLIPRLMPGDPALAYVAKMQGQNGISAQTLQNIRIQFGLSDDPLWIQYFRYLNNLLHGNLGISLYQYPTPVTQILAYDLKWTVGLVGLAAIISFILGTLLGIIVAWRRDGWLDNTLPPLLTFFSAVPYFWMALGLVYIFGFVFNVLPIGGGYDTLTDLTVGWNMDFILSVLQHGILPAITIVIGSISGWVLGMRNTMLTTLSEDYVLMAQAKGLSEQRVMLAYAARNAILPSITGFAMSLGFVVGGALLTEMVFSYPGIGFDLFNAVTNLDYSLIQGTFLVIALTMLAANFIADVVYTFLDPRVRQERG